MAIAVDDRGWWESGIRAKMARLPYQCHSRTKRYQPLVTTSDILTKTVCVTTTSSSQRPVFLSVVFGLLWYLTALAQVHDIDLEEVAERNIAKLARRYPGGFSHAASRNRAEETST